MQAEELSKSAVSAEVATDIAARLEAVRARIAEIEGQLPALRETEAWLQGVLATVGPEPGAEPSPQPSAAPEPVAADVTVPAPRREAKPAKPAKAPKPPRALKRKAAAKAPAAGAAPSLPARVLAFLSAKPDPQKTSEIAQELFGAEASTVQTNLARGAAEALVKRGQAEKAKQGATVFYQAADAASGAGAASAD